MKNTSKLVLILTIGLTLLLSGCQLFNLGRDKTDPLVKITKPTNYFSWATTSSSLDLGGLASDDSDIKSVKVSINGGADVTASGTSNWSISDIPINMGDNLVVCKATDKKGNTASDTLWVTRNIDLDFFGPPSFNNTCFLTNRTNNVLVHQSIRPTSTQTISTAKLVRLNANMEVVEELGSIFDDGNLYGHGDEILGDGVFSGKIDISSTEPGLYLYRIEAYSSDGKVNYSPLIKVQFFEPLTDAEIDAIMAFDGQMEAVLQNSTASNNAQAKTVLKNWLRTQDIVASVQDDGSGLTITYTNGITYLISFCEVDENDKFITKGGGNSHPERKPPMIPLNKQTRGENNLAGPQPSYRGDSSDHPDDLILDKDVLIWAPYEGVFNLSMIPDAKAVFEDSDLGFNVVTMTNQACTIASLSDLNEYGTIIFDTHGKGGEHIYTGELVTAENLETYDAMLQANQLSMSGIMAYRNDGTYIYKSKMYTVRSAYISNLSGTLPNSVVFNGSCESSKTLNLSLAFLSKGAKAYFGFTEIVYTRFCSDMCKQLFKGMVTELKTNGKSFKDGQKDPQGNAIYTMDCFSDELHYSFDLINGDFEMGNLTGWTRSGDGRVITGLGYYGAPQGNYMGIISTGLGFTTDSGSIAQSFYVPKNVSNLQVKWNFMSEEFLEFVGSIYQDYLSISIRDSTGTVNTIFYNNVDSFYENYDLSHISPDIVFDQGGVYGTGWHTFTANIEQYQGQVIRLIIRIGDVGDSIYDSACLLDEIKIY